METYINQVCTMRHAALLTALQFKLSLTLFNNHSLILSISGDRNLFTWCGYGYNKKEILPTYRTRNILYIYILLTIASWRAALTFDFKSSTLQVMIGL